MKNLKASIILCAMAVMAFVAFSACQKKSDTAEQNQGEAPQTVFADTAPKGALELSADMPTVIDFSATWCPPCQQLKPIYEELQKEYEGKVDLRTIDVDEHQAICSQLGIESIPTIIFFDEQGREVRRLIGFQDRATLVSAIDELL